MRCPQFAIKPDEGKSNIATALARKAVRITIHDDGLIKNANGHIEAGPGPDWPALAELGENSPRSGQSKLLPCRWIFFCRWLP
jgi:hypothetical protein